VDRKGSASSAIPAEVTFTTFALSPDGKHVMLIGDPSNELWNVDLGRGTRARLTFDGAQHNFPVWSPDGKSVAYLKSQILDDTIAVRSSSGVGQEQILSPKAPETARFLTDWSRDGKYILYSEGKPTTNSYAIMALPMAGDRKPFVVVPGTSTNLDAHFSPDGKWIVYSSNESGRFEIYVTSFPTLIGKWQVSTNGGRPGRWSPDGKEITYMAAGGDVMSANVDFKGVDFSVSGVERLFHTNGISQVFPDFDVSPDGKRFLLPGATDSEQPPITLVTDWKAALNK
jgi:dipeptidyl aminopeptidase/acylaminoacyl peptidase